MFDIFGTRAMRKEIELLAQQVLDITTQLEAIESNLGSLEADLDDKISNLDLTDMAEEAIQNAVDNATFTVRF
jgi:chromosome segregation ATPase